MSSPRPGLAAEQSHVVGEADTAAAVGSGDVPVLATPRLLAWLEAASVAALDGVLADGATSVGTRIDLEHVAPSAVGVTVTVRAEITAVDGRLVQFTVVALHKDGKIAAHGRITRVVVDRARFLARSTGNP
ncbi:MAG TPA: hotdog domain-containing protein [Jiangellaceae bacterium]